MQTLPVQHNDTACSNCDGCHPGEEDHDPNAAPRREDTIVCGQEGRCLLEDHVTSLSSSAPWRECGTKVPPLWAEEECHHSWKLAPSEEESCQESEPKLPKLGEGIGHLCGQHLPSDQGCWPLFQGTTSATPATKKLEERWLTRARGLVKWFHNRRNAEKVIGWTDEKMFPVDQVHNRHNSKPIVAKGMTSEPIQRSRHCHKVVV